MSDTGMWRRFALYLTLCAIGIARPLLQLYGNNLAVFTSADIAGFSLVWFAVVVVLGPPVLLAALDALLVPLPPRASRGGRHVLVFVAALPTGMLLTRDVPAHWALSLLCAAVLAATVAVLRARFAGIRSWMTWMSAFAPAVFVLFVLAAQSVIWVPAAERVALAQGVTTTQAAVPGTDATPVGPATPAEDVSVVWLQLDEAPLWPLVDSSGAVNKRRFPGFAALAESGTWYRNALGVSQTTVDAVPAALTGMKPVTGRAPTYSNYRKNLFALMYERRAFDVHEIATALCPKEACATISVSGSDAIADGFPGTTAPTWSTDPATTGEGTVPAVDRAVPSSSVPSTIASPSSPGTDWGQFARDTFVVLGHKLLPRGLRTRLPVIDEGWGGFGAVPDSFDDESSSPVPSTSTAMPSSPGASTTTAVPRKFSDTVVEAKKNTVRRWEADGAKSQVPVVEGMIARAARSGLPTLHFAHVLLPHRPWHLTPDMRTTRFVNTDKRDASVEDRVRDEYQAFLAQYAATDSLVLQLVRDLKKSSNWNRTMIIVTSDHGIAFEPGESKRKDINPSRTDTLEEIYRVPLFVKYPDQSAGIVDDCPVQAFDIMPTVVAVTGLDAGWTFDGSDLRGPSGGSSCIERPSRTVWWNGGKTQLSSGPEAVTQRAARFDAWVDADGDVDAIARTVGFEGWFDVPVASAVGATTRTKEKSVTRWSLRDRKLFASVTTDRFARVPLQFDGNVFSLTTESDAAVGLVVMDGRVVAVIPEIGIRRAGLNPYRSLALPSSLTAGAHSPLLLVARGTPEAPALTYVGAPT